MGRPGLSPRRKAELWKRWRAGESVSDIARALEKNVGSIFGVLRLRGGIAPPQRKRSQRALTRGDREDISRGLAAGLSQRQIAARIGRAPSTVSREISRTGGEARYRADEADEKAWDRAKRPKKCLLATNRKLRAVVARKLQSQWSPQQISGWLKTTFPKSPELQISHEAIYQTLFVQTRGALKKELQYHLRSGRVLRHARTATRKGQTRYRIIDAVSISDRPPAIEDRSVPGHWEGDLLCGARNSQIATLVERKSRFTLLVKVPRRDALTVAKAMSKQIRSLPAKLRKSVTLDRGPEFAAHKKFSVSANVKVYFCDPQSPWQRGTNENTNRLLRQYFPDGMDLSQFSQADLNRIALRLNQRPRKTLHYKTPASTLNEVLR
ncbi:MAG: IS30 family transposase [Candidatus Baltobacteraceae bacterium]